MPWVDRVAPLRFLETAFQPDDWVAVFLKSYATGRVAQRVGPVSWVSHPRFQAWLRLRNAQRFNVYVAINAIVPGRRSRTRQAIGAIRHVFLDADHDGPGVLARIARRVDLPAPSYVLHSSPNRSSSCSSMPLAGASSNASATIPPCNNCAGREAWPASPRNSPPPPPRT